MKKHTIKKTLITSISSMTIFPVLAMAGMVELSDADMSNEVGQALLGMSYTAPSGASGGLTDYGYYKLGLEAKMELNLNIRSLQLGCGGRNGPGACDIEMENVSLSGPADGKVVSGVIANNGTPTWSVGRPNTSAVLTNPFMEFAIKNPNTASTREVVGFRFSAEDILGYLSAGTANVANPTDGIKSFSGFIKVAQTPVNSFTDPAIFGTRVDQAIYAKITALGLFPRSVYTNPNLMTGAAPAQGYFYDPDGAGPIAGSRIWGINVPSKTVSFNFPETTVTGQRMSQLNLVVQDVPIPTIAISGTDGAVRMRLDENISLLFGAINVGEATFFMGKEGSYVDGGGVCRNSGGGVEAGACSYITNLKANVQVKQGFNLVHNLPISSGGYLSLQKDAMRWPGSDVADIAQPGWWMSFKDPLDFGALNPTTGIPMEDVLPQIATFITNFLSNNTINLDIAATFDAILGAPIYYPVGNIAIANNARAIMVLQDLLLDGNQKPVSNCFGGLKFC